MEGYDGRDGVRKVDNDPESPHAMWRLDNETVATRPTRSRPTVAKHLEGPPRLREHLHPQGDLARRRSIRRSGEILPTSRRPAQTGPFNFIILITPATAG